MRQTVAQSIVELREAEERIKESADSLTELLEKKYDMYDISIYDTFFILEPSFGHTVFIYKVKSSNKLTGTDAAKVDAFIQNELEGWWFHELPEDKDDD